MYILAIESSCDETSMSIIKDGTTEICTVTNTQIDIHKQFGGVVPEVASRSHIENVTIVLDELLYRSGFTMAKIDAIASTPRCIPETKSVNPSSIAFATCSSSHLIAFPSGISSLSGL